jgi:hypothetical protein
MDARQRPKEKLTDAASPQTFHFVRRGNAIARAARVLCADGGLHKTETSSPRAFSQDLRPFIPGISKTPPIRICSGQTLKEEGVYVRERGPFSGFALEAAKKLSEFIELTPAQIKIDDNRARITLAFKAPDMNSLATLLSDWDEERLNVLSPHEQKKLLASIDSLKRRGSLEVIEGQEEFNLVREGNSWRLFFDWASGIRVNFTTIVPQDGAIEAKPTIKQTVTQPNELFTIAYRVKNLTDKEVFARITHRVEPAALTEHLDVVECALLLPVRIAPGQEQSYSSTYVVRGDIPDGTKSLDVTYEFKVEH